MRAESDREREPAGVFRAATLPRWRAMFAVICAAAAFLCAGGMLEYGTGSPETHGSAAGGYWALLFAVHVAAFGGAGLIAAFPGLARAPIKVAWVAATAALYALAFSTWRAHQAAPPTLGAWLARSATYAPAALAVIIGIALSPHAAVDDPQPDAR